MNHLRLIKALSLVGSLFFLMDAVVLIAAYAVSALTLSKEFIEAANFDNSGPFVVFAGLMALAFAVFSLWVYVKLASLSSETRNAMNAELIYILGIGREMKRDIIPGSPSTASATASTSSILGFGMDDSNRWTFKGRKPTPKSEPEFKKDNF